MKKIIIFRTDRLGDYIIHSRPIYELKKKYSQCHITVVCSKLNQKILKHAKYIDKLIIYDKAFNLLNKFRIFLEIIKNIYHATFILDGKKFSYFCNIFIRSKYKLGLSYRSVKKIFNYNLYFYKPNRIYNFLFFNKVQFFTSRKYLINIESLSQKYLNLFNFFNLNLNVQDKYIFQSTKESSENLKKISNIINLDDFIIIHFDEKWIDVENNESLLINAIKNLQENMKKKIIITAFNNNFDYFSILKKNFNYVNCVNNNFDHLSNSKIIILDNLEIFIFEKLLNLSRINISCHSGFVAQVCGSNNGKLIDIINEKDFLWYSCWKPLNTFHKFVFKSTFKYGKKSINDVFNEIYKIILKL
jgi:ADP-heptose:LPS heptosyltransferase